MKQWVVRFVLFWKGKKMSESIPPHYRGDALAKLLYRCGLRKIPTKRGQEATPGWAITTAAYRYVTAWDDKQDQKFEDS